MAQAIDPLPALPEPLDDSIVGTPPRRPGSARRTSSIDMVWPGGIGTPLHLVGRARDLVTTAEREPVVVGEAEIVVTIGANRTVESVDTVPHRDGIHQLVGTQGGSYLRSTRSKPRSRVNAKRRRRCTCSSTTWRGPV